MTRVSGDGQTLQVVCVGLTTVSTVNIIIVEYRQKIERFVCAVAEGAVEPLTTAFQRKTSNACLAYTSSRGVRDKDNIIIHVIWQTPIVNAHAV